MENEVTKFKVIKTTVLDDLNDKKMPVASIY